MRPTGVQLKREAKLPTVIGLTTKHAYRKQKLYNGEWKEIVHTILRTGIIRALNESTGPPSSTDKTTLINKAFKYAHCFIVTFYFAYCC